MQDVNNDMDDLFRKAAEQYPLKTDGADWQKVLAGLQAGTVPVTEEKEKRKRRFLWLLLLLPLGLLWAVYYRVDNQTEQKTAVTKKVVKNINGNGDAQASGSEPTRPFSKTENGNDTKASASSTEIKNDTPTSAGNNKTAVGYNSQISLHRKHIPDIVAAKSFFSDNKKEESDNREAALNGNNKEEGDNGNLFAAQQPNVSSDRTHKEDAQGGSSGKRTEPTQDNADTIALAGRGEDSATNDDNKSRETKSKKLIHTKPRLQNGFYAGLMASFNASTIKLQRINKIGHDIDVLIGYRFSKRLSVETGLGWSLKNYYSKGKYFDKKSANIPDAVNIYFTNGDCKMLDVPLRMKYDFALRKKSNLFITVGLSSYFMKKENYSYKGDYMTWVYDTTLHYNNSGRNLFSVASLSIGYQLQLNKHLSLRAEPYIKMPLNGIGIAKLPITSIGITAGFTRSF